MENCKLVLSNLGSGSFGSIQKVIFQTTIEVIVIKKLKQKYSSMDKCVQLMEVHVLLRLMNHPNIIHLKQLVFEKNEILFVLEQITIFNKLLNTKTNLILKIKYTNGCFRFYKPWSTSLLHLCASPKALDLISTKCRWDPSKRPTAS